MTKPKPPASPDRSEPTEDLSIDLDDHANGLGGPLGEALHRTGIIIERRMRERSLDLNQLDDEQVAELFLAAFAEAATLAYSHIDRARIDEGLARMAMRVRTLMAAALDGSTSIH